MLNCVTNDGFCRSKNLIKQAFNKNEFIGNLEPSQLNDMADCMSMKEFEQDEYIIRQGSAGIELYVIEGTYELEFWEIYITPKSFCYYIFLCVNFLQGFIMIMKRTSEKFFTCFVTWDLNQVQSSFDLYFWWANLVGKCYVLRVYG